MGQQSPIKICDLMAADWWAPQAPTTSLSGASGASLLDKSSPHHLITPSPHHPITPSPHHPIT
ncbi:MAG: hypothetical protein QNJ51_28525 [Calothrix sp. MO_167.B12]|nr:hypothetical protein [Calothrix sp. MO_167.B12]